MFFRKTIYFLTIDTIRGEWLPFVTKKRYIQDINKLTWTDNRYEELYYKMAQKCRNLEIQIANLKEKQK